MLSGLPARATCMWLTTITCRRNPLVANAELTGIYEETITGLHKIALKVRGRFTLNRISRSKRGGSS